MSALFAKYLMTITETTAAFDPLTIEDVKASLRIDGSDNDALLFSLMSMATNHIEKTIAHRFGQRTATISLSYLPDSIELPLTPIQSVTSVTYLDALGVRQTLSPTLYKASLATFSPSIQRIGDYPLVKIELGSVQIIAQVGYTAPTTVPPALRHALTILVADHFRNPDRPLTAVANVEALISPYENGFVS